MKSWHWTQVLGTLFSIPLSAGQGTTISIGISYCPPSGTLPLPQPTIGPLAPYYLFVAEGFGGPFSYIDPQGHLTDISDAAQFIFTNGGQLTVGNEIVARNGTAVTQPLAIGPNTGSVSTTFSPENGLLRWRNNAFEGGEAAFCKTNDTVIVSFNGILPNDCRPTLIGLLLVSSLFEKPMSSSSLTDIPSLTYSTTSSLSVSSIVSLTTTTTTLGTTVLTSTLVSLTESLTATSASSTDNNPSSTNPVSAPGSPNGGSTSSSTSAVATLTSTSLLNGITASPTTTNASPSVSLITSLQTDTASTNSVTDSILSTSTETASTTVTFTDQFSSTELVSILLPPSVTSTTPDITPTLTMSNPIVTSSIDSSSDSTSVFPTSNDVITTTDTASPTSNTLTIVTDPVPSSAYSTTEITITDIFSTISASVIVDTPTSTTLETSSSVTSTPTDTSCPILPLNSNALCPQQSGASYQLDEDSFCYGILCSTSLAGTVITANSTTANTLRGCAAYCALFNNAIPYSCQGISYLGATISSGTSNCLLYGQITSELEGSNGVDSIRLIYPGYPVVQKRDHYAVIGDED